MIISTYLKKEEITELEQAAKKIAEETVSKTNVSAFVRKQLKDLTNKEILDLNLNIIKTMEADTVTFQITEEQKEKLETLTNLKNTTKARLLRSIIVNSINKEEV